MGKGKSIELLNIAVADEMNSISRGSDKQLDNIKRFGISYLALQSFNTTPEGGTPAPTKVP